MSYFIGFYRRGSEGQSGGQLPGRKLHFHIDIFPVVGFTKQQNNEIKYPLFFDSRIFKKILHFYFMV